MAPEISQEELDELAALRAAKANQLATPGPATDATASAEPTDGYEFEQGEVVEMARPDGAVGYGLVVARGAMPTVTPEGKTLAGYKVATFGPATDLPATAADLGLKKLADTKES